MFNFERSSEVVPIRTQRVPQSIETPVTFVTVPSAYVRYAYSRSSDSMSSHIDGQDYLCFQHNDQRFVGVVCDGVGSSFCGNLAARILGDGLLEWLWSVDIMYLNGAAAVMEAAVSALNRLQRHARHEVEEYEIPGQISPLIKQALESQRDYGSEAIFAAVRIDHPNPMIPNGLITICWMGDTRIHALDEDGHQIDLGGQWDNANRWSSVKGVRGKMSTWMQELRGMVGRVVAYTDGLSAHGERVIEYSDDKLDREIRAGARLPTSDDVAFLDVALRTARYEGYPDPDMPDIAAERPHLEQIWNPTGAPTYELRWNMPGQSNASFMIQEATNPALTDAKTINVVAKETTWRPPEPQPPGHYYYRVRGVNRRGIVTPWSELRQAIVAYPPPPAPTLAASAPGDVPALAWEGEGKALDYALEEAVNPEFDTPEVVYEGRGTNWSVPASSYKPGTYYYRVRAISDGGPGPWSETQQIEIVLPPPPKPHLATVGYTRFEGEYELRWQPVPGATHYELEEVEQGSGASKIVTLTDSSHRVGEQPDGQYVYRVRACHDFGCSEWSNEQVAVVTPRPPAKAPHLTIEGPDDAHLARLTWNEVDGASQYVIEISEEKTFASARVEMLEGTSWEIVRHEPGQLFFRVCGTNAGGEGPWSNIEHLVNEVPAPAWFEATPTKDSEQIALVWGAVGGPVTYVVERGIKKGDRGEFAEIYRGEDTHYDAAMGERGKPLTFRVRAEVASVSSDWQYCDPVRAPVSLTAPALEAPEMNKEGEINLRWSAVQGANHYLLDVSRSENFEGATSREVDHTGIIFRPPTSGRYWFRVRACRGAQEGPSSNIIAIQVRQPTTPSLWPIDPVSANAPFEVSWTGVPGCVYYELQEASDDTFEPKKTSTTRVFHPDQKLKLTGRASGRRHFRIRAIDEAQQPSAWSDVLVVKVR
ncbi:MAG: protein phosphatase 2C domain-containing protein [Anaerolineae bacterium]|nr:protein phosphatase 2C domain-containing protein [Anaerolineae bacterium]